MVIAASGFTDHGNTDAAQAGAAKSTSPRPT